MTPRMLALLLLAYLVASPPAVLAEAGPADRWPWFAAPGDVRSAYQALRNMPAFTATIPSLFVGERDDTGQPGAWRETFDSSHFGWARIDVDGGGPLVILVLYRPGQPCPEDGCRGFVMAHDESVDYWRIACELRTIAWSWPRPLRRHSLGWQWFTTGELVVGWRRGTRGQSWSDGPVCYRAGRTRGPDWPHMGHLRASPELYAFTEADSPYADVLRGMRPEDVGRPRGPDDWRRRFDPLLHLRWLPVHLEAVRPGAVALMLASPLLCRNGRCPVAVVSTPTNVARQVTLCTLDVPWDADVVRLPEHDDGIQRIAIGDRLIGWRAAPENPRGVACMVSELPPPTSP